MTITFQFKAMRNPTDSLPVGSEEWVEGMSMRLQYTFGRAEHYGIEELVEVLNALMPHKPWEKIPLGHPCRRADRYFEGITGKPWKVLAALIEPYDKPLALEIESYCNPGNMADEQERDEGGRFARPEFNNVKDGDYNVGNSRAYTLNRLRREAPELFNAVVAGDLSANAAAIEAGFRRKPTPLETMMRAWAKASEDERAAFRDYIDTPVMDRRQ